MLFVGLRGASKKIQFFNGKLNLLSTSITSRIKFLGIHSCVQNEWYNYKSDRKCTTVHASIFFFNPEIKRWVRITCFNNVYICGWNPSVWPFKWKVMSGTFMWYCFFVLLLTFCKMKFAVFFILFSVNFATAYLACDYDLIETKSSLTYPFPFLCPHFITLRFLSVYHRILTFFLKLI